jgi:hypothetical protein
VRHGICKVAFSTNRAGEGVVPSARAHLDGHSRLNSDLQPASRVNQPLLQKTARGCGVAALHHLFW